MFHVMIQKSGQHLPKNCPVDPVQIKDLDFPSLKVGRRFTSNNDLRKMSNRKTVPKNWLLSIVMAAIFCCAAVYSVQCKHLYLHWLGFQMEDMLKLLCKHE